MEIIFLIHIAVDLLVVLAGVYALGVDLFLLARFLIGERWWIVGFGNSFFHLLLLPTLLFLVIAVAISNGFLTLILVPGVLIFLATYGTRFLPSQRPAIHDVKSITVMTYNLHDEAVLVDQLVSVIRAAKADIVACQEVSPAAATCLATELAAAYPYQALHAEDGPHTGQGILSRYPISMENYWRNEALPISMGHQYAQITLPDKTILSVYNTHPVTPGMVGSFYDDSVRGKEIDIVLDKARQENGPVIILGDFNMADQSDNYRRITTSYVDTFRETSRGLGLTFPDLGQPQARMTRWQRFPLPRLLRLDYVFHSPKSIQGINAQVWPDAGGSDHRPLLVRLAILNS